MTNENVSRFTEEEGDYWEGCGDVGRRMNTARNDGDKQAGGEGTHQPDASHKWKEGWELSM
jgi:hypothetical protein